MGHKPSADIRPLNWRSHEQKPGRPALELHVGVSRGSVPTPKLLAPLLGCLAMLGAFSIDTLFPAFPQLGTQFAANDIALQQTISVYLFAYAGMSLFHGPLSDALGRKRVITVGLICFGLASLGCALSTRLEMLLVFRALQGLSAGVGLIVGRAVIRDLFDGADAQRLMSHVSMVFGVAPAIAPIVGGWIVGFTRWPAIFYFLVLLAIALLLATHVALPETHPVSKRTRLALKPLLQSYWTIFSSGRFRRLSVIAALNFGALFLYIASAPAFVLKHLRRTPQEFYLFFVPVIACMVIGAFVSGRLAGRMSGQLQMRIGFALGLVAAVSNIAINLWMPPALPWVVLPIMLTSLSIALISPIITLANLDLFPVLRGGASSVQAFIALLSNALIAGVVSPLLSGSTLTLAYGSAAMLVFAWLIWRFDVMRGKRLNLRSAPDAAALQPLDEL